MKNLFTSERFTFTEEARVIVLAFFVKLDKLTLARVKACGFKRDDSRKAWVRRANFDGQNAAEYLRKQLEADL